MNIFKKLYQLIFGKKFEVKQLSSPVEFSALPPKSIIEIISDSFLEEAERQLKRDLEFLHSDQFVSALKKAMIYIQVNHNALIGYSDVGINRIDMSIFCEAFLTYCKMNNIKASMKDACISVDKDSFDIAINKLIKEKREYLINDKIKNMLHVGVYR